MESIRAVCASPLASLISISSIKSYRWRMVMSPIIAAGLSTLAGPKLLRLNAPTRYSPSFDKVLLLEHAVNKRMLARHRIEDVRSLEGLIGSVLEPVATRVKI